MPLVVLFIIAYSVEATVVYNLGAPNCSRYDFYRSIEKRAKTREDNSRRVFGGSAAELEDYPRVCALLDQYLSPMCSCAVVRDFWALTAGHCIMPRLGYVRYNAKQATVSDGSIAPIYYRYRHPEYGVVQSDEGRGMDITQLHHDVGLVRTRKAMILTALRDGTPAPGSVFDPIVTIKMHEPAELLSKVVNVYGFGRTDQQLRGDQLFAVQLVVRNCERQAWYHCLCAVGGGTARKGVCTGDSGGPVVLKNVQVGVTSMGPLECSQEGDLRPGATSVFTSLYQYHDIINDTIGEVDTALRMRIIAPDDSMRHLVSITLLVVDLFLLIHFF